MYKVFAIDKNDQKLKLFEARSLSKMDEFTTHFDSTKELLDSIGLDSEDFRIKVEKSLREEITGEEVPFITSFFRGVSSLDDNRKNEVNLLKFIDELKDKSFLREFFLNELLTYEKDNLSDYDNKRLEKLNRINYFFDTDINMKKSNSLYAYMRVYFEDNYSSLRNLFMFLCDFNLNPKKIIEPKVTIDFERGLSIVKERVNANKLPNSHFFDAPLIKEPSFIDDSADIGINDAIRGVRDIDELYSEMDMYMDNQGYDDESKKEIINRTIKKHK